MRALSATMGPQNHFIGRGWISETTEFEVVDSVAEGLGVDMF